MYLFIEVGENVIAGSEGGRKKGGGGLRKD